MRSLTLLALLVGVACSRNQDATVQAVVDEMSSLDDAVEFGIRTSPNAEGLAQGESLVEQKKASLHARVVKLHDETLSPAAATALGNQCVKNSQTAKIALGHVKNPVLKTSPELVARANKLAMSLCEICVTGPSDAWMCVGFN